MIIYQNHQIFKYWYYLEGQNTFAFYQAFIQSALYVCLFFASSHSARVDDWVEFCELLKMYDDGTVQVKLKLLEPFYNKISTSEYQNQ